VLTEFERSSNDLVAKLRSVIISTKFASLMGAEVVSASPGNVEMQVDFKRDLMSQHHGFVHGGVLGFVADSACAWAAGTLAGDVVTSEYKIHFLAPAVGDRIIGRARVIKESRSIVVAQAEVFCRTDDREKLVAIALSTLIRVDPKP